MEQAGGAGQKGGAGGMGGLGEGVGEDDPLTTVVVTGPQVWVPWLLLHVRLKFCVPELNGP